jgi:hypothetical protein
MAQKPAVRVRATNNLLDFLDEYRPGLQAQVRTRIPSATRAHFDNASAVEWISVERFAEREGVGPASRTQMCVVAGGLGVARNWLCS